MHSLERFDGTGSNTTTIGDHLRRTDHDIYVFSSVDVVIGEEAFIAAGAVADDELLEQCR